MDRNTKIVLGIVLGLVLLCVCGGVGGCIALNSLGGRLFERMVIDDPAEIEQMVDEIVDYDLPPGYAEEGGMDMFFAQMLIISPDDGSDRPFIMFMQLDAKVNMDEVEARTQFQQSMETRLQQGDVSLEFVDSTTVTIRDEEVELSTYEGVDEDGNEFREIISEMFDSKGGPTMLLVAGRVEEWNQTEINTFIKSIR